MKTDSTRRTILKGSLAMAGLGIAGLPDWALPVLAQGDSVVQFTDIPENVRWDTPPDRRMLDVRTIDGPFVAPDKFATTQHYGHPDVDMATYKLKLTGMVNTPKALSPRRSEEAGQHRAGGRLRVLGKSRAAAGAVGQRQVDWRAVEDGARRGGRQARREGHRVLRRRPRRRRSRVAHAEVQGRLPLRPQPAAREGDERRAVRGVGAQRPAADQAPGRAAAAAGARLVRRRQREVAGGNPSAGRELRRQVPVALVPHRAHRDGRRRAEGQRDRSHAHEPEVVRRARHQERRRSQGPRRRAERRHADQVGRDQGRRRSVADGDRRSGDQGQVRLEVLQLHVEGRHAWRSHDCLARDRRHRRWCSRRRRTSRTRSRSSNRTRRRRAS